MTVHAIDRPPAPNEADDVLPVRVSADRWRPARAGLLNVWQFGDEVLHFERGRAVFFGPNGSGKTMALELLLPYLLDAKGQPGRLSTSSATERGSFWSRVTGYDESQPRTGYVWVEFARPSGATFTCGVRLRANASGSGERHWFTTTLRVGHELALLDSGSRPLGPQRLREALGDAGRVWGDDTARYRAAVRQVLFPGRSEEQVEALIRTLLVVRRQNVSDGLSPERLSELLSQALPPLDEIELGKVAEGFADLDRRRDHIAGLGEDLRVVDRLVGENRTYARHVTSGVVHRVIAATTELDNVTRTLRKAEAERAELEQQVRDAEVALGKLDDEAGHLEGEREGIERSEDYREGRVLVDFERSVVDRASELTRAEGALEDAVEARKKREAELEVARADVAKTERQLRRARRDLAAAVERAGGPETADVPDESLSGCLTGWCAAREDAIRLVRHALGEHAQAVARRNHTQAARVKARERLDEAESELHRARVEESSKEERWRGAVDEWRGSLRELTAFVEVGEPFDLPAPARRHVASARASAREPIVAARAECERERREIDAHLAGLERELAEWRAGREPEPESPEGRRSRHALAGAPLYRLLEFSESLARDERDRVESALLATGLLDAWVSPDGTVTLPDDARDVLAFARDHAERDGAVAGSALLVPDPKSTELDQALAAHLLASIVWVERDAHLLPPPAGGLVIGRDGTWRTPQLGGRAPGHPARFVGASSRAAARRMKIEELEHERDALSSRRRACDEAWEALGARLDRCDAEAGAFPDGAELEAAISTTRRREALVGERQGVLHDADVAYQHADEAARERQRELMRVASEHGLPTGTDELEQAQASTRKIERDTREFSAARERGERARRDAERAVSNLDDAVKRAGRAEEERRAAQLKHTTEKARLDALEASVGASFRELAARLEQIDSRQDEIRREKKACQKKQLTIANARGQCIRDVESAETARETALETRTAAHNELSDLFADGLLADAELESAPEVGDLETLTGQLESARRLRADSALGAPPDDAALTGSLGNVQRRLHEATQRLAGRVSLTFEPRARPWSVLRARQDGDKITGTELRVRLHDDRERARAELDQKQQELFEQVLTGSLREHLRARLWSARALVDRINALLAGVRSAAGGVGVSLSWEIDPNQPEAAQLREAKKLLLADSPVGDGRVELDAFLRSRIEQIRADEGDTGEWRDRLEKMLDYREWHRFEVYVHHTRFGDRPRPLRSRKVSLSAGEKTIVMVLPLIVAVVAHYEPASEEPPAESPRLLLMDELFPKLDFKNKAQLMGLLPRLELDGVFTSDKDRCEYETLDGIAIHLFQKLDDEQTTTTRMVWNGRVLRVMAGTEDAD